MKKKLLKNILTIFWGILFLFSLVNLLLLWQEYHQGEKVYETAQIEFLQAPKMEESFEADDPIIWPTFTVNFAQLTSVNQDIVGWVWFYDTVINYPLLQGDDNDAYLERTYDGGYNRYGSIFMDYRNAKDFSDTNTVIYGHNTRDGSMFATIKKFRQQDFYDTHKEFYILTPEGSRRYEIVSAFQVDALSDIYERSFSEPKKRDAWLQKVLHSSVIATSAVASAEDSFVTLSTCVSGNDKRARFVVIGRLAEIIVPDGDDVEKNDETLAVEQSSLDETM